MSRSWTSPRQAWPLGQGSIQGCQGWGRPPCHPPLAPCRRRRTPPAWSCGAVCMPCAAALLCCFLAGPVSAHICLQATAGLFACEVRVCCGHALYVILSLEDCPVLDKGKKYKSPAEEVQDRQLTKVLRSQDQAVASHCCCVCNAQHPIKDNKD